MVVPFLITPLAAAEESFRIETDVFVESEAEPVMQTLTLFSGGVVYDFILVESPEITIFDAQRGRVILLDEKRELRAEFKTAQLIEFTASIRSRSQSSSADGPFGTEFSGHYDEEKSLVLLEGNNIVYRATGIAPKFAWAADRYREFADCYAQLNAARPGNPPPFGRIELNRRLLELKMVPAEITRTLTLDGRFGKQQSTASSKHTFTWMLSTTDRKRIQDAQTYAATYRKVSLSEYLGISAVAKN